MSVEVFVFDLVSGESLGRLDAGSISWSERLNARLDMSCRLDLSHRPSAEMVPKLIDDTVHAVRPVKLVVHDTAGVTKSFMLWEASYVQRRFLQLRCAGLWSWFGTFPFSAADPWTFTDTEQLEIAADLIDWAQASAQGGGIGVATNGYTPSGRVRDRTYNGFEYTSVGQRVDELASVIDGFDFAIDTTFDGNITVTETWVPSYPRAGRAWPASGIQIDMKGTGRDLSVTWTPPTTDVREIGAGEGTTMLTATANHPDLSDYPPMWQVMQARKSVERQQTLQGHADRDLQLANRGTEAWAPTLVDEYGLLKTLTVGDECQLVIAPGDFRYPDGLEVVRRVIGRTVTVPDDGGPDVVQLELEVSDV